MNLLYAFKFSLRSLTRDRLFTSVNVIGLSLGIMSCSFLFIYCHHQLTYDQYHENLDQTYRINTTWLGAEDSKSMAITMPALGRKLVEDYSFVLASTTISVQNEPITLTHESDEFTAKDFRKATVGVLDVFTFNFISGDSQTALQETNSLIINRSWAEKIFGTTNCVGQIVKVSGNTLTVTGVFDDWPQNIDLPMAGVISSDFPNNWEMFAFLTYVKLQKRSSSLLSQALTHISEEEFSENQANHETLLLQSQPLKGLHFAKSIMLDQAKGSLTYVYLALSAGCILILIILVNTSNLSMIRTVDSIKQMGIRRILGANTYHLFRFVTLELSFIFGVSWVLGITLFQLMTPFFNELTGIAIIASEHLIIIILYTVGFFLLVLIAGLYANRVSIGLKPVTALKNKVNDSLPGSSVRKVMVVFQFIITGTVVSVLALLMSQWVFIKNKHLGFDSKGVIVLSILNPEIKIEPLRNALSNLLESKNVSCGSWGSLPGSEVPFTTATITQDQLLTEVPVHVLDYDSNYLNVFEIPVISSTDKNVDRILVNQALAKLISDPNNASIQLPWLPKATIGGVVRNYNFKSLHNEIEPLVLLPQHTDHTNLTHLYLKAAPSLVTSIEGIIRKHWSREDYQLEFLDEKLMNSYKQEKEAINIIMYFSGLSLFIAIIGLLGVVGYMLKRRMYEIGIRMVLGANTRHLLHLFGKEILKLLVIAAIFTFPLAIILKGKLLSLYAYKVDLDFYWSVVPSLAVGLLAYAIVGLRVIKATLINPAQLLRDE